MATIATMAMLKPKCLHVQANLAKPAAAPATVKPISLLSLQNLPKGLVSLPKQAPMTSAAIAGAIFSTLSTSDAAFAAQQVADLAEGNDSRGLLLLVVVAPAIGWVLFNILQPALNQLNRMRSDKGFVVGLGLGSGLAAAGLLSAPEASATEIAAIAEAANNDSRGLLLLLVVAPAIGWVLFNILQPALNQINRMRSG